MKQADLIVEYTTTFYKMKELCQARVIDSKKFKKYDKELDQIWPLLDEVSIELVRKKLTGRPGLESK